MPGTNSYDKDNKGFARKLFILYVICYFGIAVKPN